MRGALHRRVRGGPSLTADELQAIRAVEAEEPGWLKAVGLCGLAEAQAYIAAGDFHDWLEQPEGMRLLVATLRWQQEAAGRAEGIRRRGTAGRTTRWAATWRCTARTPRRPRRSS
ncbi:hypothetical protein ACFQVA_01825 [Actinomadura keratinilytica]